MKLLKAYDISYRAFQIFTQLPVFALTPPAFIYKRIISLVDFCMRARSVSSFSPIHIWWAKRILMAVHLIAGQFYVDNCIKDIFRGIWGDASLYAVELYWGWLSTSHRCPVDQKKLRIFISHRIFLLSKCCVCAIEKRELSKSYLFSFPKNLDLNKFKEIFRISRVHTNKNIWVRKSVIWVQTCRYCSHETYFSFYWEYEQIKYTYCQQCLFVLFSVAWHFF